MIRLALLIPFLSILSSSWADTPMTLSLPQRPQLYVLDQAQVLDPPALKVLETLVIEHERLTGQQLLVVIWAPDKQIDLAVKSRQTFKAWKVGYRQENGLLFNLSTEPREAKIEIGYSMEDTFTPTQSKEVIKDFVHPYLKQKQYTQATLSGIYHTLEKLNSPLIESGKATEILNAANYSYVIRPPVVIYSWLGPLLLLLLGSIILGWVILELLAREVHLTREGWLRPHPWLWMQIRLRKHRASISSLGGMYGHW